MLLPSPNKTREHAELDLATAEFIASGGEIQVIDDRLASLGWTHSDWERRIQGKKVALPWEIESERDRRIEIAVKNRDVELLTQLINKKFDRAIKHDIEHDRIDILTGAIKNVAGEEGDRTRNAGRVIESGESLWQGRCLEAATFESVPSKAWYIEVTRFERAGLDFKRRAVRRNGMVPYFSTSGLAQEYADGFKATTGVTYRVLQKGAR